MAETKSDYLFKEISSHLGKLPDNYYLSTEEIVSFYVDRGQTISQRQARVIGKRLYPEIPDKAKKDSYLARKIIRKCILTNLEQGDSVEDQTDPYNLEFIQRELEKRRIIIEPKLLEEKVRAHFGSVASSFIECDLAQMSASFIDDMIATRGKLRKLEEYSQFLNGEWKEGILNKHSREVLQELGAKQSLYREQLKATALTARVSGTLTFNTVLGEGKAQLQLDRIRSQLSSEDKEYIEARLTEMRLTSNEWVWQMVEFRGRFIIVKGGRGGAKSYEIAKLLVERSLTESNSIILCVRETENVIGDSSLSALKQAVSTYNLDRFFQVTANTLKCTLTGSTFIFRGTKNPDNSIKSINNIKYVWVDEAQLIPQNFWTVLNPSIRRDDAQIFISYNPKLETDPVNTEYVKTERPNSRVITVNIDQNAYVSKALLQEMEHDRKTQTPEDFSWTWEGEFLKNSNALVFRGKFDVTEVKEPLGLLWNGLR